jgi:cytochrome c oxidase cbb3-type subunit 3
MEKADADIAKYMAAKGEMIDENTVTFLDNSTDIAKGRELYLRPGACVACHGEDGSGIVGGYPGVGPNLVDEYWLHGGSVQDVFKTIKYGVPEKGMIAWKDNYSAKEMAQITAFVLSLQGSNPPQQKEPQGQLYKTNNADNTPDAADNEEDDSDTAEGDVAAL